ncbi:MAG TPA: hypothetical protein VGY53_02975, partial [Isosphaeraceae bacterium]|nr:hypothetical protein [Isosphaeraceae bacterium]
MVANFRALVGRMGRGMASASRLRRAVVRAGVEVLEGRALLSGARGLHARHLAVPATTAPLQPVAAVRVIRNVPYRNDGGHPVTLDLYLPGGQAPPGGWPAIVGFPGGGWKWASKK